ncbi:MAG: flagellar biosynthesis protein FliQ [Lachnospiraceae bacterium]|jgi:flagellar biosynthetic protein FliQ|uniref:flagellar biosynthesis protein FliQ n=1 Tax=uncultured Acetatifactor sp. TaxID=1671927 RepID=UPI002605EB36|nr:flagellar biosynthesis protein FliQ [uncultured Acetatifactor sp.]MCI8789230.1 flagellar biosynthesis protein FliQ [Lachnospiraceae bacterium]
MTIDSVMDITRQALYLIIEVSLPVLLVSLCVGLAVSIFQTVTSIQEQTLTFVPKIICVFLSLVLFGNWMMTALVEFMTSLWSNFGMYMGG